jgi:phage shock protein PspC (stress-responsive transcriptional regulator)
VSAKPVSRPSLRRRVDHRLVAGVVGGIADWLNAPVWLLRVVVGYGCVFSLWVLAVYAVMAMAIPARGRTRPSWDTLVGLGRLALLWFGPALVYWGGDDDSLFDRDPALALSLGGLELAGLAILLTATYPHGPSEERARRTVLGALPLVGFVGLLLAGSVLFPGVRWERAVPVGVVLAGLALAAAAQSSHARALVGPAVVASVAGVLVIASGARLQGGVGDEVYRTSSLNPPAQRLAVGDLHVVLADLPVGRGRAMVRASVGVGNLHIVVPPQARIVIDDAQVGRGQVTAGTHVGEVFDFRLTDLHGGDLGPLYSDRPAVVVHIVADVGLGTLDVHRTNEEDTW